MSAELILTDWFAMSRPPSRSGAYEVKGGMRPNGEPWPPRLWFDAENHRWRLSQFSTQVYHPYGAWFTSTRWRGILKERSR